MGDYLTSLKLCPQILKGERMPIGICREVTVMRFKISNYRVDLKEAVGEGPVKTQGREAVPLDGDRWSSISERQSEKLVSEVT